MSLYWKFKNNESSLWLRLKRSSPLKEVLYVTHHVPTSMLSSPVVSATSAWLCGDMSLMI